MRYTLLSLCWFVLSIPSADAADKVVTRKITIQGGAKDAQNVLVVIPMSPEWIGQGNGVKVTQDTTELLSQIAKPSLLSSVAPDQLELTVLVPSLKAGQSLPLVCEVVRPASTPGFQWKEVNGLKELFYGDQPLVRYMNKPYDPAQTKKKQETANPTIKPYHHLFAPDGKTLVTNGPAGQFPHHRGIFYGFNNITFDKKKLDVWHCRGGEHTEHEKFLSETAGPLSAGTRFRSAGSIRHRNRSPARKGN